MAAPERSKTGPDRSARLAALRRRLTETEGETGQAAARERELLARKMLELASDDADRLDAYRILLTHARPLSESWHRHFRHARRLARSPQSVASLLLLSGDQLFAVGRYDAASVRLTEAVALFERSRGPTDRLAMAALRAAQCFAERKKPEPAGTYFRRAADAYRSDRQFLNEAICAKVWANALHKLSCKYIEHLGYPLPRLSDAEARDEDFKIFYEGAAAYRELGELDRAADMLSEARRHLRFRLSAALVNVMNQHAGLSLLRGHVAEACDGHRRALGLAARCRVIDPRLVAQIKADLAYALLEANSETAREAVIDAAEAAEAAGAVDQAVWGWTTAASIELDKGRTAHRPEAAAAAGTAALSFVDRAYPLIEQAAKHERRDWMPRALGLRSAAHYLRGEGEAATRVAVEASRSAWQSSTIVRLERALSAAQLLLQKGDADEAYGQAVIAQSALSAFSQVTSGADAVDMRNQVELTLVRCMLDSSDQVRKTRGEQLRKLAIADARARGDHVHAGRLLNLDEALLPPTSERLATGYFANVEHDDAPRSWDMVMTAICDPALPLVERAAVLEADRDHDGALALYERALALQLSYATGDRSEVAAGTVQLMLSVISLRLDQGDRSTSLLSLIDEALSRDVGAAQRSRLHYYKGKAFFNTGDLRSAIACFDAGLDALPVEAKDERLVFRIEQAEAHIRLHEWQTAVDILDEVEGEAPDDPGTNAALLQARASAEHMLGRNARAVVLLRQALELVQPLPTHDQQQAMILVDLGHALSNLDIGEAIEAYEEAIGLIEAVGDRLHLIPAREGLLHARVAAGLLSTAEADQELAWLLEQRRNNGDREGELSTLLNHGFTQLGAGNLVTARASFDRSAQLARQLGAVGYLIRALHGRALARDDRGGEAQRAIALLEEACSLIEQSRAAVRTEDDRADFLDHAGNPFSLLTQLYLESGDRLGAFIASERVRALGMRDLVSSQQLRSYAAPEVVAEENAAWDELEALWATAANEPTDETELAIAAATTRLRRARMRMTEALPALAAAQDLTIPTPEALGAVALRDEAVLVIYTIIDEMTVTAQCLSGDANISVSLSADTPISDVATSFAVGTARGLEQHELSRGLYDMLIAPIEELVGEKTLIIAPDGALHQIPFAALLMRDPSTSDSPSTMPWLIRRNAIRIVPSASVLMDVAQRESDSVFDLDFAGFADPGLTVALREPVTDLRALPTLPFARVELEEIANVLESPKTLVRLGSDATRAEFDRVVSSSVRWLHLACHALVDEAQPWASRIVMADDGSDMPDLTAAALLRRRLRCQLAVLSCCSTGLGRVITGEGSLGLPRAFLASGADTVCATLWPVLDSAGPPVMAELYRSLVHGVTPWEALRRAQCREADTGASPESWAAYVIIG